MTTTSGIAAANPRAVVPIVAAMTAIGRRDDCGDD